MPTQNTSKLSKLAKKNRKVATKEKIQRRQQFLDLLAQALLDEARSMMSKEQSKCSCENSVKQQNFEGFFQMKVDTEFPYTETKESIIQQRYSEANASNSQNHLHQKISTCEEKTENDSVDNDDDIHELDLSMDEAYVSTEVSDGKTNRSSDPQSKLKEGDENYFCDSISAVEKFQQRGRIPANNSHLRSKRKSIKHNLTTDPFMPYIEEKIGEESSASIPPQQKKVQNSMASNSMVICYDELMQEDTKELNPNEETQVKGFTPVVGSKGFEVEIKGRKGKDGVTKELKYLFEDCSLYFQRVSSFLDGQKITKKKSQLQLESQLSIIVSRLILIDDLILSSRLTNLKEIVFSSCGICTLSQFSCFLERCQCLKIVQHDWSQSAVKICQIFGKWIERCLRLNQTNTVEVERLTERIDLVLDDKIQLFKGRAEQIIDQSQEWRLPNGYWIVP